MKKLLTMLLLAVVLTMTAQTARDEIKANPWLAGSNYLDYDRQLPDFKYTQAPAGYVPFYFSHYGRHGSRWLIGDDIYERVLRPLRKAADQKKLTAVGQETLAQLELFNKTTYKRLGDLTTVGERQHHGIGKRIAEHFPEIFKTPGVAIDARSTTVNRCILSMVAECEELMAANPTARIHNDVSESLQYYLNQPHEGKVKDARKNMDRSAVNAFTDRNTRPVRLMNLLFNDQRWVADSIQAGPLMRHLFEVVINMQSHDDGIDMLNLFTNDELYDQWRIANVSWYVRYANAPLSGNTQPFSQYNLLKNIIETADTVTQTQATLRFGHEVCVMPLACLLELDNCGAQVENLDTLDHVWRNYRIFPMACNVQLVFYRPKKGKTGDILVKALLNERETTLPVSTDQWPYYRWQDLRQYYLDKIAKFERH